jgi:hypothetical protein
MEQPAPPETLYRFVDTAFGGVDRRNNARRVVESCGAENRYRSERERIALVLGELAGGKA